MIHLANLSLVLILWINLVGLSIAAGWLTGLRNPWMALTFGPWLLCSCSFFSEFFHGWGGLGFVYPLTTLFSLGLTALSTYPHALNHPALRYLQKKMPFNPWRHPEAYLTFFLIFSYALFWRYSSPDIDASSEKIGDLSYICSYLPGATLPAPDSWLAPYLSTHYYSFQFYAAALLGRILDLDPGTTYNLSFATLVGLAGTAAAGVGRETYKLLQPTKKSGNWHSWLVTSGWIFGGTGVTGIIYLLTKNVTPWAPMRFIGNTPLDQAPLGTFLATYTHPFTHLDLPGESYAYNIYLGDYHPPLSGYYVALTALLALVMYHRNHSPRYLLIVTACFSWSVISDIWNLPLEAIALAGWALYNFRAIHKKYLWIPLLVGALLGYITIYPYFRYFALAAGDYHTHLKLVAWNEHTPPLLYLLFLLPTIGLSLTALFTKQKTTIALGCLGLVLLAFGELVYVDDVYSGTFERFNSTLKWWPWISTLTLLTLGVRLLLHPHRWIFWISLFFIGYPILYGGDLLHSWITTPKPHFGQLDGKNYLINDSNRALYIALKSSPRGVTLEDPEGEAYTNQSAMTLFAGQPCYLGWMSHEQLWRGYSPDIRYRYNQVKAFYSATMSDPAAWLSGQNIRYVLWFKDQNQEANWQKINNSIKTTYRWQDTFSQDRPIGMWVKNS